MEQLDELLNNLIALTILLVMFGMGLQASVSEAFMALCTPRRLAMLLLASVVLVPVVAYVGTAIVPNVQDQAVVGLMLMAAASGNGLVPKLAERIGSDIKESTSELIVLSLVTIVSAPVVLSLMIPEGLVSVDGLQVAADVVLDF